MAGGTVEVRDVSTGAVVVGAALPVVMLEILAAGGLVAHVRRRRGSV
jgi:hypothetical protein